MSEEKTTSNPQLKISEVVFTTLRHWPWILLSVLVCVGLAVLYVLRAQPTFTRTAAIVIKDDSKGKSLTSDLEGFADMGLIATNTNIIDEVNKLQSPDVMREVVRRLGLTTSYSEDGTFHRNIVYGPQLPVTVQFPGLMDTESVRLTLDVDPEGRVTLSDVERGDDDFGTLEGTFALGDTLRTPAGSILVQPTPYYKKGEPVHLYVSHKPLEKTVEDYSDKVSIAVKNDKGNTIDFTAVDGSTQRAEDLINAIISVYNERWIENRNQISVSTSNFINDRLAMIENELGNVDQNISSYQSEHLIPDVQQAASMALNESQQASAAILDLNNQLQMSRYMRTFIANEANRSTVLPQNSGIGNASIEQQIAAYNEMMLQRNQYAANSSDTHPVVIDLDSQLASLRSAIVSSIDNQIVALDTQIRNLQGSRARATAQIAANPSQAKYLLSVERQQKVKESLYLFLLQKREENELSQAFTAYNTQVITMPHGSNIPTSPQSAKIIMAAFMLGLILPFGVTYVVETNNTKVRGRKDIEGITMPFLGEIPASKAAKDEPNPNAPVVVKQGKRDAVNEAFRVMRTNIGFMTGKTEGCTVVMVTSFNPGSGKTFITSNLAISLAIRGKRVLVVDCDLRRCSTSAYVGTPKQGLSDYLAGSVADIQKVIVSDTIVKGLAYLPVGTIPPNPTELLETDRFRELIAHLRTAYDFIFIDCPPVEMMADAQIVASVSDRTFFVIRAGLLEREMLPELDKLYAEHKFPNMALILNGTAPNASRYGHRYGYGYGYGNYGHYTPKE